MEGSTDFGVSADKELALGGVHTVTGERVDLEFLFAHQTASDQISAMHE